MTGQYAKLLIMKGVNNMRKLQIVKNGLSPYHIVTSYFADECERYAASELQKYIYESTNTLVPYFSDICERRGMEILIGYDARNAQDYIEEKEFNSLMDEGFIIKTAITGDIVICSKTSRGTLYGVYTFLERFLGFRAFTKDVEKIDYVTDFSVSEIHIIKNPDFEYRDAYFRGAFDGGFASKNKLNTSVADISREKGGNMKFFSAHHTFESLLPSKNYFKKYPQYYAEIDGKRKPSQPCLSNPDVVMEIATNLLKIIEKNPHCKVFSVAQNDNHEYCKCEKCRKIDEYEGSPAGSMITFVNKVAEIVESKYPDVLIHTFAYVYTRKAPKYVRPRRNIIVRLCNIECEWSQAFETLAAKDPKSNAMEFINNLKDWTAICDRVYIWDYAVNFRSYLQPFPNFYQMAENIKFYKKCGIKGVLQQGNFSYGGGAAMDDLKSYLIGKLLWNAESNLDSLIDEFLCGVYGKGAPYIKEYLKLLTESVKGHELGIYDLPDSPYFTDELVEKYDLLFKMAEDAAENDEIKTRIQREHLSIEYLKAVRIEDYEQRCAKIDDLAEKIKKFKITEIMERVNLYDSFEYMKREKNIRNCEGRYSLYYVVK